MKKVLIGLAIVVVILGGGVFLLFSNLDKIVETGIETAGTSAIGSRVEVGSVSLDLVGGAASIYEFSIANPTGFSNAQMISFDELSVSMNLQGTSGERIHINSVVARSPHVLYEATGDTSNMDVVSARFESEDAQESGSDTSSQVMLVIDSILIENIQGTLLSDKLPQPLAVNLGDVRLSNLEGYPEDLAKEIMAPVISQIGAAAAQALVESVADLLEQADEINQQVNDASDRLQRAGDQASEALDRVGNIFKKD